MRPGEMNELLAAPPLPFRRVSPYRLELQERSGWVAAVFGIPFFLASVFMALSVTGVLPFKFTPKREWDFLVLPLVALAFLGLGGAMFFGRRWLTLDLSSGSAIRQEGLLIPMLNEVRRLSEFTAVVLSFDSGDSDSPARYPVRL